MDIMLTVSYCLKIQRDEFYCPENGHVKEEIEEQLENMFPKEVILTNNLTAQREHLMHIPLQENKNCLRCASCGKWLYMPGKEYLQEGLEYCRMVKNIPLCPSCAWELESDMQNEEFVQKLKKGFHEKES